MITYEEVINLLGNSDNAKESYLWYYDSDEGRFLIQYESGGYVVTPESQGKPIGWQVPKWTVVEVSFWFDQWIDPKKSAIDFKGFTSSPIYDVPKAFEYRNDELDIDYVLNKGKIEDITFRPAKKYDYLRCKKVLDLSKRQR